MTLPALRLLLPCHSLEDFPTFHTGGEAENLLIAWTGPWHPLFLRHCQKLPEFGRVENTPDSCAGCLFLVPQVAQNRVPGGFPARCQEEGGDFLVVSSDRPTLVQEIAQRLGVADGLAAYSESTTRAFFALGYTFLHVELLTRQLRYTSNLDLVHFESLLLKAARAAADPDPAAWEAALERCFDLLSEERHRYYPMPSFLCDVTLLAPSTLGSELDDQLRAPYPVNWLTTTDLLAAVRRQRPDTWTSVQQAVNQRSLLLATGGFNQAPVGLLDPETWRRNLTWSQSFAQETLTQPHRVFARRLPGLEVTLPTSLLAHGFRSGLHEAFEETRLPSASHTYLRWQGVDGETLPSLTKTIYDASDSQTFLKLGIRIGETLDIDHVAASQFVHWPGQASVAYTDLMESATRCDALGKWCLLDDLIANLNDPGYSPNLSSFDYRAGYLKLLLSARASGEAVDPDPDPIQQVQRLVRHESQQRELGLWAGLAQMVLGRAPAVGSASRTGSVVERLAAATAPLGTDLLEHWEQLLPDSAAEIAARTNDLTSQVVQALTAPGSDHRLLLNPDPQVRRRLLTPDQLGGCQPHDLPAGQVYAAYRDRQGWWAVVDVPPMGYQHFAPGAQRTPPPPLRQPKQKIASGKTGLRNEFLSAMVDPETGSLRSIHDYQSRTNLCSLQLAWFDQEIQTAVTQLLKSAAHQDWRQALAHLLGNRDQDGRRRKLAAHASGYSAMKADRLEVVTNNPLLGHLRSTGRLMLLGKSVGTFVIDYRLHLGSRFLHVACQLQPVNQTKTVEWNENARYEFPPVNRDLGSGYRRYFAWRFAQSHPSAEVYRDLHGFKLEATRPTSTGPKLLEFRNPEQWLSLCTGGLAFHRFPEDGKADLLLTNGSDGVIHSEIAIGISPKNGLIAANQFLSEPAVLPCGPLREGLPKAAWLFRCSSAQALITDWQCRYDGAACVGVTLRLQETAGRTRKIKLEFASRPTAVRATLTPWADPALRQSTPVVRLEGDTVECGLSPFEQMQLEVDFGAVS
jgi:alpha-mannosidase